MTTAVLTQPVPLAVGQPAALDIIISNGGQHPVHCDQIIIVLPAGHLAQDLLAPGERPNTTAHDTTRTWTFTQIQPGVIEGQPPDEEHTFYKATPDTDNTTHAFTRAGLRLRLDNFHTNEEVGTARLEVRTHVRHPGTNDTWTWEYSHHYLDKYPARPDLVPLTNLRIVQGGASSETVITQTERNQKFTLKWDGPNTAYTLYSPTLPNGKTDLADTVRDHTIEKGVERDTTFTLCATAQSVGHQKDSYLTTTIAVEEPSFPHLTVDKITANGEENWRGSKLLTIDGALRVEKESHFFGTVCGGKGTLTVGDDVVAQKDLTVSKDMNVAGAVEATGDITTDAQFLDPKGTPLRGKLT
ncbi:hypothetical protein [Streptomyces olivoreticuli]|uniref:hypothetical protein n=1 Tax=Streptomyces olivoreticuli TaxID=68246 RepID=UPI000E24C3F8|nr:hypothetical protein [Streptomyces olivoreticuli]